MNIKFGNILSVFLEQLAEIFHNKLTTINDYERKYAVKTAGKLSKYEITVFSNKILYYLYPLFTVRNVLNKKDSKNFGDS